MRILVLFFVTAALFAEVRTMTLKEVVDLALKQSPDVIYTRLDEQRALHSVEVARDPFFPKIYVGSGLAYSSGFPMSIEGSAPSILRADAVQRLFDRQLSYKAAQAKEDSRGVLMDNAAKREQIALQAANLFLDAEHTGRSLETVGKQVENLERVVENVRLRASAGRELGIEVKRAEVNLAKARQRVAILQAENEQAEGQLAMMLGLMPGDRVQPEREERRIPELPPSGKAAVDTAMTDNREIRRLESAVLAKNYEIRANRAARWPRMDLVAQYGLFAKFNNYEDWFRKFQRHNGQLGVSFQVPISSGRGALAQAAQAETDAMRLRTQINQVRSRIVLDAQKAYGDVKRAEAQVEVARQDLDLSRESLSLLLAQLQEGRVTLRSVEEARFQENEKWLAMYDGMYTLEKARLALLKQTGSFLAAMR